MSPPAKAFTRSERRLCEGAQAFCENEFDRL